MTNVTSKIIAGIDKAGNRGEGSLAGSHEVASHQGRIKEGLAGRPVGKGWECAATEEEGQHRSNRLRIVWELTSRNLQAAVTDARTRLSQNFPGKVCLINGLWWILWFKSNALEVAKVGKKFKRDAEISVDRFGLLRKQSSWTQIRSCQLPPRKSVNDLRLTRDRSRSRNQSGGEKNARFKLRLPYQILYRFHCNFLPVSCRGYNAAHVTADMTAKWSTIDSYRRNDRKCTCRIGVMAAMGFTRIEYRPFLLARKRDAKARLFVLFPRGIQLIKRERNLSPISWFLVIDIWVINTSFSNFQGDF